MLWLVLGWCSGTIHDAETIPMCVLSSKVQRALLPHLMVVAHYHNLLTEIFEIWTGELAHLNYSLFS